MKKVTTVALYRLLASCQDEIERYIKEADYAEGSRNDLRDHFVGKFRSHLYDEQDLDCNEQFAIVRAMTYMDADYLDDIVRSITGRTPERGEMRKLILWFNNWVDTDFLVFCDAVYGALFDAYREREEHDFGAIRSICRVLRYMDGEVLDDFVRHAVHYEDFR